MKTNVLSTVTNSLSTMSGKIQKHSPEILVVSGVVGIVTSAVLACRATTKVQDILDESKERIESVHDVLEDDNNEEFTEEDGKRALAIVYVQTGAKIAKLYGPALILGGASIAAILGSHNILSKRNAALAAAYATIDRTFKDYRGRVVEKFGEAVDRELRYDTKMKKITTVEVDEEGKEKKLKSAIEIADAASGYARFFEEYVYDRANDETYRNPNWDKEPQYNVQFLKAQQMYANDILKSRNGKPVFLNEVYTLLGLPTSKEGQIVGWIYDPENPNHEGDNYISFGMYSGGSQNFSDFIYGSDDAILLDFNVDGNVWASM